MHWLILISYLYFTVYVNSNTSCPVPCTQSIDAAMMSLPRVNIVKRSVSLSISDFEEMASLSTPLSPGRLRGSFIMKGSKKKSLTTSLSAGSDYPVVHKTPYMLVKW